MNASEHFEKPVSVRFRVLEGCPDAFEMFVSEFLDQRSKFFLESSVVRPGLSRFSFMGDAQGPLGEVITYDTNRQAATIQRSSGTETIAADSLFDLLKARLAKRQVACDEALPFHFNLGYVGYLGYELKSETIGARAHPSLSPDATFMLATRMIAFDHDAQKTYLLHMVDANESLNSQAQAWFDAVSRRIARPVVKAHAERPVPALPRIHLTLDEVEAWIVKHAHMRHSRAQYIAKINEALAEIVDGESYEVCLTNIIEFMLDDAPADLYRMMRSLTPAPYAGYFAVDDFHLVSSSPERFVRVDSARCAEAKPIKGTRPRGATPEEDAAQIADLRNSEKDRAENLMIVDLLRNDLGQVSTIQSVHVPKLFDIETYSHVHQLVSTIRSTLKPGVSTVDAVRAVFPGGSMTGAPKRRTMEIIDRLEEGPRGAYSGALGWFGLGGACDFNIVIRSVAVHGRRAQFGVGGAITALSDPAEEFEETMVKARGMVEAVEYLREQRQ